MHTLPSVAAVRSGEAWALRVLFPLRDLVPLVRQGAAQTWIHVAWEGTWEGHRSGAFEFTRACFETAVRNFEAQANPAPLDYEHASEWAPEAPAAGWVQRLEVRDSTDGLAHLWALVELTDKAAELIKSGAYRFSSGVFDFAAIDRRTGEEIGCVMRSLALTNLPFIDGQQPIRLSQRGARALSENTMDAYTKKDLLAALDEIKGNEVTVDQLIAVLAGKAAAAGKTEEPAPEAAASEAPAADLTQTPPPAPALDAVPPPPAPALAEPPASEPVAADAGAMLIAKLQAALPDMDAAAILAALDAKVDQVAAVLRGEAGGPGESATLSAAQHTIRSLTTRLGVLEEAEAERKRKADADKATAEQAAKVALKAEAETKVTALVTDGLLLREGSEVQVALYLSNRAAFDSMERSLRSRPPLGRHASATDTPDANTSLPASAEDEEAITAYVQSFDGMRRNGVLLTDAQKRELARGRLTQLKTQLKSAPSA